MLKGCRGFDWAYHIMLLGSCWTIGKPWNTTPEVRKHSLGHWELGGGGVNGGVPVGPMERVTGLSVVGLGLAWT